MIKPGMFISDRYEIIDKVGSGGMADVYKAKCHRLNRYVAIKILKSEFSSDHGFVQKFRAEAQSVAGLSHPNIVSVYDVGDDDGLHYIVMELVEGITLKRFIERKKKLEIKEAVGIAIQIAQGMEAAHTHHIIHRDIKPQNIIISREGKVKVADFGIAKAATSNTISQNAIGSVHYLSPEQARGGYSDDRSDIYSLGVTLYEMLCGQVPFAGDNSVSVALLHIQSEATPVQVLNPEVPTSVDKIVQKCMQKKPERRYQTASELIKDLKRSILNPDGDYVSIASNAAVADSPTINITEAEMTTIKSAAKSPVVHIDKSSQVKQSKKVKKEEEELDSMDSRLEKVLTVVSVIFAIALIIAILYLLSKFFFGETKEPGAETTPTPTTVSSIIITATPTVAPTPTPVDVMDTLVPMQLVVGLTIEDAVALLKSISTEFEIDWSTEEYSDEYEKGYVSAQYPPKDILIEKNYKIKLTVSAGSEFFELNNVYGKPADAAIELLEALGYKVAPLHEYSNDVEAGLVIRTEPEAGAMVPKDSEVVIYISDGPELKSALVPSLLGHDKDEAIALLNNAGLVAGEPVYVYSESYDAGLVCNQDYEGGESVDAGTVINFSISMGEYVPEDPEPTEEPQITDEPDSSYVEEPDPTSTPTPVPTEEVTPTPTEAAGPVG